MKCVKCRGPAVVEVSRHHAAFCRDHFVEHVLRQVQRAIEDEGMLAPDDRILVAVSGGKDSLALWDILHRLGYRPDGLHVQLGIGAYSEESAARTRAFAGERGLTLHVVSVAEEIGFGIGELARRTRRIPCSACGMTKRHLFNRFAREHGYTVVATGHNLDDEAATLLGNVLHWQLDYMARQSAVMPATEEGLVKKVKPLVRLAEREVAAYAVLQGIDYEVDECPMAAGATSHLYKEVLNRLEHVAPGTKQQFVFGFYERGRRHFPKEPVRLQACRVCGEPTPGEVCAFCRLTERARAAASGRSASSGNGR
ncbi:TIGR00269 family protein [Carboxydochorda subterranea]|uniref:TIGR00269 family protein n=1 Tax=Carboxydichorda subterranea TaxID=3109565 RepID=A0ABZ1BW32_9FIRM|nr:TIGR00269 family protein [Limnochorda sp. L945t]WRP16815.1 TIGR00269 family protein [Limnochorda sp. L945t]